MNARDVLVRNTFWYALVTVIGLLVGVGMSVVLARGLGPAQMGDYSYLLWVSRTLTAIATLGFALAAVRYTASALAQDNAALAWGFVQLLRRRQILTTAIVVGLATPLVLLVAADNMRWALAVLCLALFPATLEHLYAHAVYGAQRYEFTAQASTVKMLLQLGAAALLLALGFGILALVVANAVITIIACQIQRARVRGLYPRVGAEIPPETRPELTAYLVPLSAVVVLDALVWDRSEVFFLRLWTSSDAIAFYSLAFGLATKAMVLPEATVGALLPTFSALHGQGSTAEFRAVYRSALRYVGLTAVAIAAVAVGIAPGLVHCLYGADYAPVARLFMALIAVSVLASLRRVAWSALRGLGDRRCAVSAMSVAAAMNIAAAALLIPPLGIWGAALANASAQTVATLWALIVMGRTHRCGFPVADLARIGVAGVFAYAATAALAGEQTSLPRLVVAALGGAGVYAQACLLTRAVGPDEWRFLVGAARRMSGRAVPVPAAGADAPAPAPVLSVTLGQRRP